ncbi:MAG: HEAT repeat domain-containing protein [Candidatus Firestonebacteria bacterium]
MKISNLFIPILLLPAVLFAGDPVLSATTEEKGAMLPSPAISVTGEELPAASTETTEEDKVVGKAEQVAVLRDLISRLSESVRSADRDTGEMPEAGFSVSETTPGLEKLLLAGDRSYFELEFLLTNLKNGFLRERLVKALAGRNDDKSLALLTAALKDKSSGVRLNAARIIGREGSSKDFKNLTPLLYDKYMQRRDLYPVRLAAREAIDLIKFREGIKELAETEKIGKLLPLLAEKALKKESYFTEYAVLALGLLASAGEAVYKEIERIKIQETGLPVSTSTATSVAGSISTTASITTEADRERVLGWLFLASACLRDERIMPEILKNLNDPGLFYISLRALNALKREALLSLLLGEPEGSERAAVMLKILTAVPAGDKGNEVMLSGIMNSLAIPADGPEEALRENIEKLILSERNKDRYLDAGFVCAIALNDYDKASYYLGLYEEAAEDKNYSAAHHQLFSLCLVNKGKFAENEELNPLTDDRACRIYFPLINSFIKDIKENSGNLPAKLSLLADFYMKTGRYKNAADVLGRLLDDRDCPKNLKAKAAKLLDKCGTEINSGIAGFLRPVLELKEQKLKIELTPAKESFTAGEDVKLLLKLTNTLAGAVYFLNDREEGRLGLDAGVFCDGLLVKRLKTELNKTIPGQELAEKISVLNPGESYETSITVLPGSLNKEGEYAITVSYDGGAPFKGYEKGWIKNVLFSDRLKVKTIK